MRGFTLVEAVTVVVVAGALAAFAVPRLYTAVERTHADDAFAFLAAVRAAQEEHRETHGAYAPALSVLDLPEAPRDRFAVGAITPPAGYGGFDEGWELTLTRCAPPAGWDSWAVTFNQDGFDPLTSTLPPAALPSGR